MIIKELEFEALIEIYELEYENGSSRRDISVLEYPEEISKEWYCDSDSQFEYDLSELDELKNLPDGQYIIKLRGKLSSYQCYFDSYPDIDVELIIIEIKKTMTEQFINDFNEINDYRHLFLKCTNKDALITAMLHFLGDDAQLWYHYNGYHKYRLSDGRLMEIPSTTGRYLVVRKDGKIHFENWNGTGWAYNDNSIEWWQPVPKKPTENQ